MTQIPTSTLTVDIKNPVELVFMDIRISQTHLAVNVNIMSEIELINADCLPAMKEMQDKQFDLAIVDPPYGIGCAQTINIENLKKGFIHRELHVSKDWDNKRPSQEYFNELQRVSNSLIIWGGNYFTDFLYPVKGWLFWDKKDNKFQGSYFSDGELAWTNINTPVRYFRYGWIGVDYINNRNGEIKQHPTQKPVKLYEWLLKNYAKPGDTILDTHLGSGSIAIACYNMGYSLIGYEIDKDYYSAACKRLEEHKKQLRLFEPVGG